MKKIEVEIPEGKRAEWVNNVLTLVDDKPVDIREKVRGYDDACKLLGRKPISDVRIIEAGNDDYIGCSKHIMALMKLETIVEALNEGWVAKEHINEEWWYPWFNRFDKSNEIDYERYVPAISSNGSATDGGVVSALAPYDASYTYSSYGSHLALKSKELAEYCGNKFIHLWADYLLG